MLDISRDDALAQIALARRYAQAAQVEVALTFCIVYPDGRTEPADPFAEIPDPFAEIPPTVQAESPEAPSPAPEWRTRELLAIKQALEQYIDNEVENGSLSDTAHLVHDAKAALETLAKFTNVSVVDGPPKKKRGRPPIKKTAAEE
jgi:hypothetical protein